MAVVVTMVMLVHMPLGHHGDGHGSPTGRGCGGRSCMAAFVGMVKVMVM